MNLLVPNNFASRTAAVNQTVFLNDWENVKTYFCELVLGFSTQSEKKNTAVQFAGLFRSKISKNMLKCILWEAIKGPLEKEPVQIYPKVVIDRYWFFRTDTDYLYVYVPDNRYLFTVIK